VKYIFQCDCNLYSDIRQTIFDWARCENANSCDMDSSDKVAFLMNCDFLQVMLGNFIFLSIEGVNHILNPFPDL